MQTFSKRVSMTVVKRLPKYYQYLTDLQDQHIEKISSKELAAMMGLTASQIRQDLNSFGAYGQQGYGYKVKELKEAIRKILGTWGTPLSIMSVLRKKASISRPCLMWTRIRSVRRSAM